MTFLIKDLQFTSTVFCSDLPRLLSKPIANGADGFYIAISEKPKDPSGLKGRKYSFLLVATLTPTP